MVQSERPPTKKPLVVLFEHPTSKALIVTHQDSEDAAILLAKKIPQLEIHPIREKEEQQRLAHLRDALQDVKSMGDQSYNALLRALPTRPAVTPSTHPINNPFR